MSDLIASRNKDSHKNIKTNLNVPRISDGSRHPGIKKTGMGQAVYVQGGPSPGDADGGGRGGASSSIQDVRAMCSGGIRDV